MIRIFFFLLFAGGVALAGFPWLSDTFLSRSIGSWRVYDNVTGALPAQARLTAEDAPLTVLIDMTTVEPTDLRNDRAVLTLTAAANGRTVLAEALTFADAKPRDTNPQTGEKVFRETAGVIETIDPGPHTFTLGIGDAEGVTVRWVDLTLKRVGMAYDERIQPTGFAVMAIGFIGFVLAFGRGKGTPPQNPNSQPPPPRWGRSAGPQA